MVQIVTGKIEPFRCGLLCINMYVAEGSLVC